ncbi:MAG TPA: hypothetical protein VEA99_00515 [Gemmatimonadaceae bacterium]|nr:hypothetical protein [Gemmatimonadaceae bacterium]
MRWLSAGALLVALAVTSEAAAQGGLGPGRGARRANAATRYDTATVETITGTVARIDTTSEGGPGALGIHLALDTDKGRLPVHLGPAWYLAGQPLKLAVGDRLTVRGSRITFRGQPALIAAQVRRGDSALSLRNASGLPAWRGQGRGRRAVGR